MRDKLHAILLTYLVERAALPPAPTVALLAEHQHLGTRPQRQLGALQRTEVVHHCRHHATERPAQVGVKAVEIEIYFYL